MPRIRLLQPCCASSCMCCGASVRSLWMTVTGTSSTAAVAHCSKTCCLPWKSTNSTDRSWFIPVLRPPMHCQLFSMIPSCSDHSVSAPLLPDQSTSNYTYSPCISMKSSSHKLADSASLQCAGSPASLLILRPASLSVHHMSSVHSQRRCAMAPALWHLGFECTTWHAAM